MISMKKTENAFFFQKVAGGRWQINKEKSLFTKKTNQVIFKLAPCSPPFQSNPHNS